MGLGVTKHGLFRSPESRTSQAVSLLRSPPFYPRCGFGIWFYSLAGAFSQCHGGSLLSGSRRAHDGDGWEGGEASGVGCWGDIPCPFTSSRRGWRISRHRWLFSSDSETTSSKQSPGRLCPRHDLSPRIVFGTQPYISSMRGDGNASAGACSAFTVWKMSPDG